MTIALCILAGGIVLVAVMLVIKVPREKVVDLAEAFGRWIGGAPKPPALSASLPRIKVEIAPAADPEQRQIEPPAA
jgi:hypothetical protein